jgi:hypothetical protein
MLLALAGGSGCDERADASPAAPSPAAVAPPGTASARSASRASPAPTPPAQGSASGDKCELRVLKAVFTSDVKNKEPADVLTSAKPGQRVWAHLTVRNRCPSSRSLALSFQVGGSERSKVDLDIEPSWSYRTWGYVTLRKGDMGKVELAVKDEDGSVLVASTLPIKSDEPAPPQARP